MKKALALSVIFLGVILVFLPANTMGMKLLLNYQGQLQDGSGNPVADGNYEIIFSLWDDPNVGSLLWAESLTVPVQNGLFNVVLGNEQPPDPALFSVELYMQLQVGADPPLTPRSILTTAPYSAMAMSMPGFTPGPDNQVEGEYSFAAGNNNTILSDYGSITGGQMNHVENLNNMSPNFDTSGIFGGGPIAFSPGGFDPSLICGIGAGWIGGGFGNLATGNLAAVGAGSDNQSVGGFSSIIGGCMNRARGGYDVVAGGYNNETVLGGGWKVISGGFNNKINSSWVSTIGGGYSNIIDAPTVGGTIGGGFVNRMNGHVATIAGGYYNGANDFGAAVGGGQQNIAQSRYTTVGGGLLNVANQGWATIGGGYGNSADAQMATISGGGRADIANSLSANEVFDNYGTIGGGANNKAGSDDGVQTNDIYITIGGGGNNQAFSDFATIAGGDSNLTQSEYAVIGGGRMNIGNGPLSAVGGGLNNQTTGYANVIAGGEGNFTQDQHATISGGFNNSAVDPFTTIAGGDSSQATAYWSTVGGGHRNSSTNEFTVIPGGDRNTASGHAANVGGGIENISSNRASTVSGGETNVASGYLSAVGGGIRNTVTGDSAVISGGSDNRNDGDGSVIAGGHKNGISAASLLATIGGGTGNSTIASGATIAGGANNSISLDGGAIGGGNGNKAGFLSTVPGGLENEALGDYSFAAGTRAKAVHSCAYVWADCCIELGTINILPLYSAAPNTYNARATGGFFFFTACDSIWDSSAPPSGAYLPAGGSMWLNGSDRNLKRNVREVNNSDILDKVASLPIYQWSYKTQDESIEHIGPMAQDFYKTFEIGDNDKSIGALDPAGICLAAIKQLREENIQLKSEIENLKGKVNENDNLSEKVSQLTELVNILLASNSQVKTEEFVSSK